MITDGRPFRPADDSDIFHRQNGKEEVFVGSIAPILVHYGEGLAERATRLAELGWAVSSSKFGANGKEWNCGLVFCFGREKKIVKDKLTGLDC